MAAIFTLVFILFHSLHLVLSEDTTHGGFIQCLEKYSPLPIDLSTLIYFPNTTSYSSQLLSSIQNLRYASAATPKPVLIITPNCEFEVQATVYCCKANNLPLRIRSGGHDYEGLSYHSFTNGPFVLLDLAKLRSVDVDVEEGTAWVQVGATIGDLYYRIGEKTSTYGFPAGVCATLGTGGHFSGGGMGTMVRKYGLSADNILDAIMVDANGWLLDRESMDDDLFWAIRGGGGGNFGIILAWKVKLVPVPPTVTVVTITKRSKKEALDLIHKWQTIAPKLHENIFIEAVIRIVKAAGTGVEANFNTMFLGECSELLHLMGASFPELGVKAKDCKKMSWVESTLYFAGFTNGEPLETLMDRKLQRKAFVKAKSDFVMKPVKREVWDDVWERFSKMELAFMSMYPYGGRMAEIEEDEIPFPHRKGNLYNIQYVVPWQDGGVEAAERNMNWIKNLHDMMAPHVSKNPRTAYVNFRDLDLGRNEDEETCYLDARVWGRKYFKGNFWRLAMVKGVVDPDNFFRSEQSIPPLVHWA
ncbi:berberine bridge enzyme-like 15 [Dioscorea cayenensis subsp. rotundata]|uniref:Berberine bridge enzyme-like 15 n=1 Tax=Dioscorea cayennensis subsp. rotundata TaxID=55577 RepID=A0AB40AN52_DIOCR|nr:berberine bridge enzyme-like 15 [Dioscorea cayenensis subsp. rotundata]